MKARKPKLRPPVASTAHLAQAQLHAVIAAADASRAQARWTDALVGYRQALELMPGHPVLLHNSAVCLYSSGQTTAAHPIAKQAWQTSPALWQAGLLYARILLALRERAAALRVLQQLHASQPHIPEIRLDLALQTLHQLGNARAARALLAGLRHQAAHAQEAWLTQLVTELYDTDRPPEHINADFIAFAQRHLQLPAVKLEGPSPTVPTKPVVAPARMRIGLISPQFFVSPVYFFSIGALKLLAADVELIIFSRDRKRDWATDQFAALAREWVDVADQSPETLAATLKRHQLDILVDLGGWMDPQALRALSVKPARRLFKWVGGQSLTTGIRAFDGFISDPWQTPPGSQSLFVEPLVCVPSGYVTYTPPPYLPAPQTPPAGRITLGIMANPAKISSVFLAHLRTHWPAWSARLDNPLRLRFVDRRFAHPELVDRLQAALPDIDTEFIAPADHRAYLNAVGSLHAVIDTSPYSGGLTTIEALALGVPCLTVSGSLFCSRHTQAHLHYAGLGKQSLDHPQTLQRILSYRRGQSLLAPTCQRLNHLALAGFLFRLFKSS